MVHRYKSVGLSTLAAVAVSAAFVLSPTKADAAVMYASSATEIGDASGTRGTADDRDNINNALGSDFDTFFELGFNGVVKFQFGNPTGQQFFGPGAIVEITTGSADTWPEAVEIEVGTNGDAGSFVTADPNPFTNQGADGTKSFTFSGGPFDTVRLTDVTLTEYPNANSTDKNTGGFDVAAIGVSPVPLPASALLLLGGLGGLGGVSALRRRKRVA